MRFWCSWNQPTEDPRPLRDPPDKAVLGWWNSGEGEGYYTLVALVEAKTQDHAAKAIKKDWPEIKGWRFCEERPAPWEPPNRFVRKPWIVTRIEAANKAAEIPMIEKPKKKAKK